MTRHITFLTLLTCSALALADDRLPIVFHEDFERGADRWQPL